MSIERLSPAEQVMLWPDQIWPQDIGALIILDGTNLFDPEGSFRIGMVREVVASRLHLVPRFRHLLYTPPRHLGGPLWVDDPPTRPSCCAPLSA
jgi:diacylglycerol O-acyltransferase / wax synthase